MKKWTYLLTPALLISASLEAWGGRFHQQTASSTSYDPNFPLNIDQGWFVEQSYLLLKPTLGDIEYGDMVIAKGTSTDTSYKIKVKSPDFEWNSGVRLGFGRYLPNHDNWDISLYTTYFYGDTTDHSSGDLSKFKGLVASYDPFITVYSESTDATWRLNYFVWDLAVGRMFAMTPQIIFHPYVGLRASAIYTTFFSKNSGDIIVASQTASGKARIRMHENFWGIGPRVGTNFDYKFTGCWSFLSNFAASFLYGHYHVKEKSKTTTTTQNGAQPTITKSFDHDDTLRINLEGAIGLGWESWFQNNSIRVAPNLQFEGSLWFDMNDFFRPATAFSQDHGNLGLMGLTFNLQVDF